VILTKNEFNISASTTINLTTLSLIFRRERSCILKLLPERRHFWFLNIILWSLLNYLRCIFKWPDDTVDPFTEALIIINCTLSWIWYHLNNLMSKRVYFKLHLFYIFWVQLAIFYILYCMLVVTNKQYNIILYHIVMFCYTVLCTYIYKNIC